MSIRIDKKTFRILYTLEKNARASINELARVAGISKELARYKLHRLESEGVIKGYRVLIDTGRLGYTTYRIYFKLREADSQERQRIIRSIGDHPLVTAFALLSSSWDAGVAITVRNTQELHAFWTYANQYRRHIKTVHFSIYQPLIQFTRTFLNPDGNENPIVTSIGEHPPVAYDELDLSILKHLAENARVPLARIAKALDKPLQTIINRVKSLEQRGIIQGYRPLLDWKAIGYHYYKANITLRDTSKLKEMQQYAKQLPFIYQIDLCVPSYDLELEVAVRDHDHFLTIMDELHQRFPGTIEDYDHFYVTEDVKEDQMPG